MSIQDEFSDEVLDSKTKPENSKDDGETQYIEAFSAASSREKKSASMPEPGDVASHIGTGKYAKTNIIWYVISAVFVTFSCICISLVVLVIYDYKINDITQSIKDVWSVFTPILTLSLGYLFGKRVDKRGERKSDE